MNDNVNRNPANILWSKQTAFVWLGSLWLSHLNCQHIRAIKAAQKQKYTVKAPHGAEQQELWDTRPPFLNQPFLWRPEWRGVEGDARWKWIDKHLKPLEDGWIYWGTGDKGMWRVSVQLGLIPQHFSQWQIDSQRQTTAASTVWAKHCFFFFHSQWQGRSRSWLRGLNHLLTMSLCEISFSHMVAFKTLYFFVLSDANQTELK